MEKTNKITLSEFRAWLDGLLAGRDMEHEAVPTRDQWKLILAELDRVHNPVGDATRMMLDADLTASYPRFRYTSHSVMPDSATVGGISTSLSPANSEHQWTEINSLTGRVYCAKCLKNWKE